MIPRRMVSQPVRNKGKERDLACIFHGRFFRRTHEWFVHHRARAAGYIIRGSERKPRAFRTLVRRCFNKLMGIDNAVYRMCVAETGGGAGSGSEILNDRMQAAVCIRACLTRVSGAREARHSDPLFCRTAMYQHISWL